MLKGSFAFFGVTNENTLSVLESYGRVFNMPYVTHSAPTNRSREIANYGYVLHVRPTYDEAMVEIIKFYKWGQVFYIYDNDEGKNMVNLKVDELDKERKTRRENVFV